MSARPADLALDEAHSAHNAQRSGGACPLRDWSNSPTPRCIPSFRGRQADSLRGTCTCTSRFCCSLTEFRSPPSFAGICAHHCYLVATLAGSPTAVQRPTSSQPCRSRATEQPLLIRTASLRTASSPIERSCLTRAHADAVSQVGCRPSAPHHRRCTPRLRRPCLRDRSAADPRTTVRFRRHAATAAPPGALPRQPLPRSRIVRGSPSTEPRCAHDCCVREARA